MSVVVAPVPRLYFGPGRAVQLIIGSTYEWVDPISGEHLAYVTAEPIEYEPTIERQMAKGKRP